jgi:predicted acyltransferase
VNHVWPETRTWDPEGLLSTLGAVGSVVCGVLVGHWVRSARGFRPKAFGLFYAGAATLVVGWIWSRVFPINKSLWTSSYVLLSAGMACLVLAAIFWLVDIKGYRRWTTPFLVFGTNAITAYWLSTLFGIVLDWITFTRPQDGEEVVLKTYLYDTLYATWLSPANASLAYAVTYVLLWLGLLSVLYRRRIFIRI